MFCSADASFSMVVAGSACPGIPALCGGATGANDKEVAKQLRMTNWTVGFWRKRFNRGRLEAH